MSPVRTSTFRHALAFAGTVLSFGALLTTGGPALATTTEPGASITQPEPRDAIDTAATAAHRPKKPHHARHRGHHPHRHNQRANHRHHRHTRAHHGAATRETTADKILSVAKSKYGAPYRYGADGPDAFDCSGFTQWVFAHVGKSLPRTSSAQAGYVQRVSKPRPGDLVFFGGAHVYHVGIYAGDGSIIHAPYTGAVVRKEHIWDPVFYGRVR